MWQKNKNTFSLIWLYTKGDNSVNRTTRCITLLVSSHNTQIFRKWNLTHCQVEKKTILLPSEYKKTKKTNQFISVLHICLLCISDVNTLHMEPNLFCLNCGVQHMMFKHHRHWWFSKTDQWLHLHSTTTYSQFSTERPCRPQRICLWKQSIKSLHLLLIYLEKHQTRQLWNNSVEKLEHLPTDKFSGNYWSWTFCPKWCKNSRSNECKREIWHWL